MKIFYKIYFSALIMLHIFLILNLPLTSNMTGLMQEYPLLVSCWSLGSCGYILIVLYPLSISYLTKFHHITINTLILSCCILTLILPYNLVYSPLLSSLHLIAAYCFFFLISSYFLYLLFKFYFIKPHYFKVIFKCYVFLIGISIITFLFFLSITTIFEIIYTLNLLLCSSLLYHFTLKYN